MKTITIEEIIKRQNKERGFDVTQIDKEAFLKRIAAKDWSAYFLGKTFCSMYRTGISANLDFTNVCRLDSQGTNFLFKTIFARDVQGWNCEYLYSIEQEVKRILDLVYEDGMVTENHNYVCYEFKKHYEINRNMSTIDSHFECTKEEDEESTTLRFSDGSEAVVYDDGDIYVRTNK